MIDFFQTNRCRTRKQMSLTLSPRSGNRAVLLLHQGKLSSASIATPCVKCSIKQQMSTRDIPDGYMLAPADVPPAVLRDMERAKEEWRLKQLEEKGRSEKATAAATSNDQGHRGGGDDGDDETLGGDDNDAGASSSTALLAKRSNPEESLNERDRDEVIIEASTSANCNYRWTTLRDAIDSGICNVATRDHLWLLLATENEVAFDVALPDFEELVTTAVIPKDTFNQICKDLYRSAPEENEAQYFISNLYRGLLAHAVMRPKNGYVQGMNMLWAMIILNVSNPDNQLRIADHIVRNVLPYYYSTDPPLGHLIDGRVLDYYFSRRWPEEYERYLASFTLSEGGDRAAGALTMQIFLNSFCSTHFPTMFAGCLPRRIALRIWDNVMLRGPAVLFEFSVRSLHYFYKKNCLVRTEAWVQIVFLFKPLFEKCAADIEAQDALYKKIWFEKDVSFRYIPAEDVALRRRVAFRKISQ